MRRVIFRLSLALLIMLVVLAFSLLGPHYYSKWYTLALISNSSCRYLLVSEYGIDSDNSRDSKDLLPMKSRLNVLLFDSIATLDYSMSKESPEQIVRYAELVGDTGVISSFVVSEEVEKFAGVPRLQELLWPTQLAVIPDK